MVSRAGKKGLSFSLDFDQETPSNLIGDPSMLRQILVNLISNSIKFTEKGEIKLVVKSINGIENKNDDGVIIHFAVIDSGIGIPPDKLSLIFEKFSQADSSTSRKYGGTGLGLAICKKFVEIMGGAMEVVSNEGEGSEFSFTVVMTRQNDLTGKVFSEEISIESLRILLMDSSKKDRQLLTSYLLSWDYSLVEADDSREGLAILEKETSSGYSFDLIIFEADSKDMARFEMAREIRENRTVEDVKILALASHGERGDASICKEIGIQGYMTKPIKRDHIYRAIQLIMEQGRKEMPRELVTQHLILESENMITNILLVEDYPTNQQVAMRHLESAGYRVALAETGEKAIKLFTNNTYDLVLMDLQLPGISGYDVTIKFREYEAGILPQELKEKGSPHTPIIALTAHAIKEEKEKCLANGMDDFITKPLRRDKLLATVNKWTSPWKRISNTTTPVPEEDSKTECGENVNEPMNYQLALKEFEGDKEFLTIVIQGFFEELKLQKEKLKEAVISGESEIVSRVSHAIKGGAANLTAVNLAAEALKLEKIGKSGDLAGADEVLGLVEKEIKRLQEYIAGL
jgi:two-component system, sensor histidine kinase and response regulator